MYILSSSTNKTSNQKDVIITKQQHTNITEQKTESNITCTTSRDNVSTAPNPFAIPKPIVNNVEYHPFVDDDDVFNFMLIMSI